MYSRQTFTLRELGTEIGSYVQYDMTNFSAASLSAFPDTEFFISGGPSSYGINQVSWSAPTFDKTNTLLPVDVMIRWSPLGEPQTAEDGFELVAGALSSGSVEHDISTNSSYQGNWIYYSMFLRYASTDTNPYGEEAQFFERVASISTLMPKNYGSIDILWSRIPEYFRTQDTNNNLYDYLSIFSWDIDQLRTIIDYLMVQNDPTLASSFSLQYLMEELGTLITTLELGASRARNYMHDIINLRLAKGTEEGLISTLQAISGCQVAVDQFAKQINVYPQRVNWARDPRLLLGLQGNWYGAVSDSLNVRFSVDYVNFNGASNPIVFNGSSVAFNPTRAVVNDGTGTANVFVYGKYLVPVSSGDTFYFSAGVPTTDVLNYVGLYYADGTLAASAGTTNSSSIIKTADGSTFFKLSVVTAKASGVYPLLGVRLNAGQSTLFDKFLLEKGFMGKYFDGYTNYGGWLRGGTDRSDYRWHNNPTTPAPYPYSTYGIYTADSWRVRKTIGNIYKNLLPVNYMDAYSVVYDYLPSYSATPLVVGSGLTLPTIVELLDVKFDISSIEYNLGYPSINSNLSWPNLL